MKPAIASPNYHQMSVDTMCIGDLELFFLNPDEVEEELHDMTEDDTAVSVAIERRTDLIPNVYEGGLKIWECSFDLVSYLHTQGIHLEGMDVLELGCGVGLPGIYAMRRGAAKVHFQDYNKEVIEHLTVPSVMLNMHEKPSTNGSVRFFAGDWSKVRDMLASEMETRYDVILTAETIYSVASHDKLYQIMKTLLKPEGAIFLAAKMHYFGVGGGTRIFEEMVKSRADFDIDTCQSYNEGVKREILKMKFKNTGDASNS